MNKILKRMLERLHSDYDKSEGGLFFDVLSPISIELENAYKIIEERFKNTFAETASGEYLDKIANEIGVTRRKATYSRGILKLIGEIGTKIPKGSKFSSDTFIFKTVDDCTINSEGYCNVEIIAEKAGLRCNLPSKSITKIPVTIPGLNSIINEEAMTGGFDEESDEDLRMRYFIKVREPLTSGNIYHYRKWALDVKGVGAVKVFPLWQGPGTVKLVIIDINKNIANQELIQRTKEYIEALRPIGADVTVTTATPKNISISVKIKIADNVVEDDVKRIINENLIIFFKKIDFNTTYLSYAKINQTIIQSEGVLDIDSLTLNEVQKNIEVKSEEILTLSNVEIEVIK